MNIKKNNLRGEYGGTQHDDFAEGRDCSIAGTIDAEENGIIQELGYVPAYRRVLGSLGNMSVVIGLTSPLSAFLVTASYQVTYAGYWGLSWGWILPNIVMLPEVLSICELASSMPVNGAFYWWTGALAPPEWSHAFSFICGWLNVLSMFTATASFAYAVASTFSYALLIAVPSIQWTDAQMMGLSMGIVLLWAVLMCFRLERIAAVYIFIAVLILVQTLLFIFGLPISHAAQNRAFATAQQVFAEFSTYSDWTPAVAAPYSWFAAMWVNSAWMVPVYLAEETQNATREVPKSLLHAFSITAVLGTIVSLLSAFCITDMAAAATAESGYPLFDLIIDHWGLDISTAFFLFVAPAGLFGGSGTLLTYASQMAAFARDGGFPWHERMAYVHPRLNLPIYSIALLVVGTWIILLLALSGAASQIIYSLSVVASLVTFLIPIVLRIFAGERWVPGPFNLGRWSIPVALLSVVTQLYIIIMECFPYSANWDYMTFNYNAFLTVLAVLVSCLLYVFGGRKHYKGLDTDALRDWRVQHAMETR